MRVPSRRLGSFLFSFPSLLFDLPFFTPSPLLELLRVLQPLNLISLQLISLPFSIYLLLAPIQIQEQFFLESCPVLHQFLVNINGGRSSPQFQLF